MLCEKILDSMDLLDAAAPSLCFTAAIYGLMDTGCLEQGHVKNHANVKIAKKHVLTIRRLAVRAHS